MNVYTAERTPLYGSSDPDQVRVCRFSPNYTSLIFFTNGQVDIGTPDAGWEPQTAVAPATPVQENEWYDYTVYLEPEVYTVRPGHWLGVYIEPKYETFGSSEDIEAWVTFDLSQCYAVIPTDTRDKLIEYVK